MPVSLLLGLVLFATSAFGGRRVMSRVWKRAPVEQTDREICHHGVFLGATGAGKTTGLLNQWRRFARRRYALLWLGLDGDDCRKAYGIAKSEGYAVRFLDVADEERDPPPYNLLRQVTGTEGELEMLAGEFVSVVRQLNAGAFGKVQEAAVEEATVTALEEGRRTGREVTPQDVLRSLRAAGEEEAASKVARLLRTSRMRRLLGTPGGISLAPAPGEALIISLDLGKLQSLAPVLAGIFASGILREGFLHDPKTPVLGVFLDEWQLYAGPRHPLMLEQLRRRGVAIQAAMQHLHQADARLQAAIRQVGSLYLYRQEIEDAKHLGPFFGVEPQRLANLPDHVRLARELLGGRMRVTFQHNAAFGRERPANHRRRRAAWLPRKARDRTGVVRLGAGGPQGSRAPRAGGPPAADDAGRTRDLPPRTLGGAGGAQGGGGGRDPRPSAGRVAPRSTNPARPGQGGRAPAAALGRAPLPRGGASRTRPRGAESQTLPGVFPEESSDLSPFDVS